MTLFGATVSVPLVITPRMCFADDVISQAQVISAVFCACGIATFLQTTLGSR